MFFRISRRVIYFFILSRSVNFCRHFHASDVSSSDAFQHFDYGKSAVYVESHDVTVRDVKARSLGASFLEYSFFLSDLFVTKFENKHGKVKKKKEQTDGYQMKIICYVSCTI